jgi:HEAT repeat protein
MILTSITALLLLLAPLSEPAPGESPETHAERLAGVIVLDNNSSREALEALKNLPEAAAMRSWQNVLVQSKNPAYKVEAINRIARTSDRRKLSPIVAQLDSPYSDVRQAAIAVLSRIADDRVYPKILEMSRNTNPVFRVYAAEALAALYDKRFIPVVTDMIRDDNKSVRILAIRIILKNRIDAMYPALRNAAAKDENHEVTVEALKALASLDDASSIYIFIKALSSPDAEVRRAAADNIVLFQVSRAAFAVSEQLEVETDPDLKSALLEILIRYRNPGNFRGLERIISTESSPALRVKAAVALGFTRSDRAEEILVRALADPDYQVRSEACSSLGMLGSRRGAARMVELIRSDNDLFVRTAALYAVERIRDKETILPLYDMLAGERDPLFRELLTRTLRSMIAKSI